MGLRSWCLLCLIHGFTVGLYLCCHIALTNDLLGLSAAVRTWWAMEPMIRPASSWCYCTQDAWLMFSLRAPPPPQSLHANWNTIASYMSGKPLKLFKTTALDDLSASSYQLFPLRKRSFGDWGFSFPLSWYSVWNKGKLNLFNTYLVPLAGFTHAWYSVISTLIQASNLKKNSSNMGTTFTKSEKRKSKRKLRYLRLCIYRDLEK